MVCIKKKGKDNEAILGGTARNQCALWVCNELLSSHSFTSSIFTSSTFIPMFEHTGEVHCKVIY
jgi:hypothetical protein